MRQLSSLDSQFLALETARTYGHVGGLAIYDPSTAPGRRIELEDVCRLVAERLPLLPPFTWRLVDVPFGLDHPYWIEDPDFDIDFHIRDTAVPPPGDDRQLSALVARIFARPLDRARPLWELYLIHGVGGGDRVAMLTKIHHAVVDGVSGAEILSALLDLGPEGRDVPDDGGREAQRLPSQLEMLGRGLLGLSRQPLRAAGAIPSTLPNLLSIPGVANVLPGTRTVRRTARRVRRLLPGAADGGTLGQLPARAPRTPFNGRISAHRRFAFGSLSLERVKAIKNAMGISVNDVVVTMCASAVRRWLDARDALPQEPLVAMVPVSVRSEDQVGTYGNRISAMFVPIPTDVDEPRERLVRAHESLRGAKEHHKALPAALLQDATKFIPSAVAARAARVALQLTTVGPVRPPLNLIISNVPGPRQNLFAAGARLEGHFPVSAIADGAGLNMTVMSYRDALDFGIVADRDQVDDAWELMDALRDALEELDEAVCGTARPDPRRVNGRGRPARGQQATTT